MMSSLHHVIVLGVDFLQTYGEYIKSVGLYNTVYNIDDDDDDDDVMLYHHCLFSASA